MHRPCCEQVHSGTIFIFLVNNERFDTCKKIDAARLAETVASSVSLSVRYTPLYGGLALLNAACNHKQLLTQAAVS